MASAYRLSKKVLVKDKDNIEITKLVKLIIQWNLLKGEEKEREGNVSSAAIYYQKANDIVKENYDWLEIRLMKFVEDKNTSIKNKLRVIQN